MASPTTASVLRSSQAYCSQICRKQTLTCGIAYYSRPFARLPEANQLREVVIENPSHMQKAFDEAEEWFSRQGLRCYRWAPAGGQADRPLADFLPERGFRRRTYTVMALRKWMDLEPAGAVRVLPARAMRAALRETFRDQGSGAPRGDPSRCADACDERLDDPQFDLFVALVEGAPAGRCALFQVGDVARVMDLQVSAPFAGRGVRRALTGHVLALAKRLALRNVCLQLDENDEHGRTWFERAGFAADGTLTEWQRE